MLGGLPVGVCEDIVRFRRPADANRIVARVLSEGTAAQIVRSPGGVTVQVNETIPEPLHAAVARHVVEQHSDGCYTFHCVAARSWLRPPQPARYLTALGA